MRGRTPSTLIGGGARRLVRRARAGDPGASASAKLGGGACSVAGVAQSAPARSPSSASPARRPAPSGPASASGPGAARDAGVAARRRRGRAPCDRARRSCRSRRAAAPAAGTGGGGSSAWPARARLQHRQDLRARRIEVLRVLEHRHRALEVLAAQQDLAEQREALAVRAVDLDHAQAARPALPSTDAARRRRARASTRPSRLSGAASRPRLPTSSASRGRPSAR